MSFESVEITRVIVEGLVEMVFIIAGAWCLLRIAIMMLRYLETGEVR